jgi:PAS domain S-box-containing protein
MSANPASSVQPEVASEQDLFRTIVDSVHHMVWTANPDGTLDFLNARCAEYTGLSDAPARGGGWRDVLHPDDLETCAAQWARAVASGETYEADYRLRRADGEYRWHRHVVQNLRERDGRIFKWFGTCTDIEEQRRAFHQSENRFRSFMDNLPASAWIKDSGLRLSWVSPRDRRLRSHRLDEILGRTDFDLRPREIAHMLREQDEEVRGANAPRQFVFPLLAEDGREEYFLVVKFPLADAEGRPGVAGIAIDITESHRLQNTVRQLLRRRVQAQEDERRRVAGELHDLVGQKLTALGIMLGVVRGELPEDARAKVTPRIEQMSLLVEETMAAMRGMMGELRPPVLDDHGLAAALHQHAAAFEARTGMRVHVQAPEQRISVPPETKLALFRIAQEALTNAAKHSGATLVRIVLKVEEPLVEMLIEDDGRGFIAETAAGSDPGHWGLRTIHERAEAVGGTLRIDSGEAGTLIIVSVRLGERRKGRRREPGK